MKRGRVFPLVVFGIIFAISQRPSNAAPALDLWMEFNSGTSTVEVHRENIDFGLGSLTYDLAFNAPQNIAREYSSYGWVANDGEFDGGTPGDGSTGSFASVFFDTVHSPAGTEFAAGTGIVETLTFVDPTPRWIFFDILSPIATDGAGTSLVADPPYGLGGTLTVRADPDGQGHTFAVYIPEPVTILLFGAGGLFVLTKPKK
jgi:hypothetical protein